MNTHIRDNFLAVGRKYASGAGTQVAGTTVETDLLGSLTVAAGDLGATGRLSVSCWGRFLQNSGTLNDVPTFRLDLTGVTQIWVDVPTGVGISNSTTSYSFRAFIDIQNLTAASQVVALEIETWGLAPGGATTLAPFLTGTGQAVLDEDGHYMAQGYVLSAVNTAVSMPVTFNVINADSSANYATHVAAWSAVILP